MLFSNLANSAAHYRLVVDLPIVLVSALNADRMGPVALAAGMSVSFVSFGVFVTAFGTAIGLTQDVLAQIGAILMIAFGLVLVVPTFAQRFELAAAGVAGGADVRRVAGDRKAIPHFLQSEFDYKARSSRSWIWL